MNTSLSMLMSMVFLPCGFDCGEITSAINDSTPATALVILNRESSGCPNGQIVKEDVTIEISKEDNRSATIYEIKNPEDIFDRNELYLLFPAMPVNGLTGDFVVKLWCNSERPEIKAYISLDYAKLHRDPDENWVVSAKVKGNGLIHAKLLYSREAEVRNAWVSCPDAEIYEPYALTFFNVYPLTGHLTIQQEKLSDRWQTLVLQFNSMLSKSAVDIDRCQTLLAALDKQFSNDRPLLWDRKKVQAGILPMVASKANVFTEKVAFQILLKADDGITIRSDSNNFVPHLRQKLALKNPDGNLVGAELWLKASLQQ